VLHPHQQAFYTPASHAVKTPSKEQTKQLETMLLPVFMVYIEHLARYLRA